MQEGEQLLMTESSHERSACIIVSKDTDVTIILGLAQIMRGKG